MNHLAPAVREAKDHLSRELSICDGWPSRGESAGRGTSDRTTTEAAVLRSGRIQAEVDRIDRIVAALEAGAEALAKLVVGGMGERVQAAADVVRCREAQRGRDAHLWSNDMECMDLPSKSGLCGKHYAAYYRYRRAHNIKTDHEFEPA